MEAIAQKLTPVIHGVLKYYCKFWTEHIYSIWYQLNQGLLKWVKWEKSLYKKAAIKWLQQKYKAQPSLFPHWQLVLKIKAAVLDGIKKQFNKFEINKASRPNLYKKLIFSNFLKL